MLRTLLTASFALSLVAPTFGQGDRQAPARPAKPFTLTQVWTFDATYTDQQHGVTFRYPSVWQAKTGFGYHPPALTASDEKPIAGFGYGEGGFPRDRVIGPYSATNLEGFGIVYSAIPLANATECEARASSMSDTTKHRIVMLGGRSFSEHETGSGGMSQSISGKLYATYLRPICYLFETDVAVASPGALDDIPTLTPAQLRFIDTHLLNIMKSVRIVPRERQPE
jgi:hypothetical protein